MKFRNIIRMNMILATFGAAMFFASSAYAQQDMDPATFNDGPNVEPMPQPVPGTSTAATTSPVVMSPSNAQLATFTIASPSQVESAAVWPPVDRLALMGLLACAALILLYEIVKAKRQAKALDARARRAAYLPRDLSTF
jgi:hypothetical protein